MILHKKDKSLIGLGRYKGSLIRRELLKLGYGIAPADRGKGYATEAALALIHNAINIAGVNVV